MKKISLFMMALLNLAFAACDDDYATEVGPQSNPQENLLQLNDVSVTTGVQTINISELINGENGEDPIKIGTVILNKENLPANAVLTADVQFATDENFENVITVRAQDFNESYDINVTPSVLQDAYFNSITHNPTTRQMYVRTILYAMTAGESVAIIGSDGIKYFDTHIVNLTPLNKVQISPNYYIVGGPNDWATSAAERSIKFNHSDVNVYDDPVFTVTFDAAEGDTWFAIGDDEACDAIGNGDWSKLLGIVGGNSQSTEGKLDFRYNMGAENSFCVPAGAKQIRVTINMMDYTFEVKAINFAEYIYEAGVNNSWGGIQQPLYCADGNGLYTGFFYAKEDSWTGGLGAFKFRGAVDNWDNGNWGAGTYTDEGGTLTDTNADNLFATPGFYRADVDLASMTYTLTRINSVFVVGSAINNDWDKGIEMTYNVDELCWECDATLNGDVIKFKGNGTWDTFDGNWGGTMDNIINGSNDNIPVNISGDVHIKFYPMCDTRSYCTIVAR